MATRSLGVTKDTLLVLTGGKNWGAGQDYHLFTGTASKGGHRGRWSMQLFLPNWTANGITKVTASTLPLKLTEVHTLTGATPRLYLRFITADWIEGTVGGQGAGTSETWSDNGNNYPGPTAVTVGPTQIDTGSLAGKKVGDVVQINLLPFIEEWA